MSTTTILILVGVAVAVLIFSTPIKDALATLLGKLIGKGK